MAIDICEKCGHPSVYHPDGGICQLCTQLVEMCESSDEICQEFKPDVFNMWKDEDEDASYSPKSN